MSRVLTALALMLAGCAAAAEPAALVLRDMGSFHIGGRQVELSGKPVREVTFSSGGVPARIDPNGFYQVEQMYVQYFLPKDRRGKVPLLMWHGGGLTGASYETTPDGREGWVNLFLRSGWDLYVSDAVERGRSGFAPPEVFSGEPLFLTQANPFERFRIGAGSGAWNPDLKNRRVLAGNRFPAAAYDAFTKQIVPRWTTTDDAILAAYQQLVDKVCPCVILFHSQAGQFGFRVAQDHPDKVKALVAVEPAVGGDKDRAAALKDIPTVMLFGDYIAGDARWRKIRDNDLDFVASVRAAGGVVDVVDLPDIGITGNSHMMMMDSNNAEIAALIQAWLARHGLVE